MIRKFLSRFLSYECINDPINDKPYLHRWWLLGMPEEQRIYLHNFVADDWSRDFHDHPKWFISIGLKGSYVEETPKGKKVYKAPWIRYFPPNHIHRIALFPEEKSAWTLVITGKAVREWGFWTSESCWVHWKKYLEDNVREC